MPIAYNTTAASQALRGQSVKVTLSLGDFQEFISNPLNTVGLVVDCGEGAAFGTIGSIDTYGNSFKVVPIQPNLSFNDVPGYLNQGAIVTIYN